MSTGKATSLWDKSPWESHDWKVKTIESLAAGGGSRLAFRCRSCGRVFGHMTASHRTWAVNQEGLTLTDEITSRWLAERCPGQSCESDDDDRSHLKKSAADAA